MSGADSPGCARPLVQEGVNGALNTPIKPPRPVSRNAVLAFVEEWIGRMGALEIALAVAAHFPHGARITMGEIAQMERARRLKHAADPLTAIDMALAEIGTATGALERAGRVLAGLRQAQLDSRLSSLPPCDVPVTEHRREHRMGRVPKIDADPALPTFILARLDRLTYHQVAAEIAAHFPPAHHIHPATIHRWAQRHRASAKKPNLLR